MHRDWSFKQILLAALAWWACAALCMGLSVYGGMVSLIWWPNGIAVAALFVLTRRKWPIFLALAMVVGTIDNYIFGMPPVRAVGIAFANFAEATVAAALAQTILQRTQGKLIDLKAMFSLVGAGLAGGMTSTSIMFALEGFQTSLLGLVWWCSAVTLGTLVATPIALSVIEKLSGKPVFSSPSKVKAPMRELLLTTILVFGISLSIFEEGRISLLFLPMAATIFAASRYGHVGATVSVLAISIAGGVESFGGQSPAQFLELDQQAAAILLQVYMMILLATSVPLAALLMAHDALATRLEARNARMRENLTWLGMAEEVARIGRWRYDPKTGHQNWSRQMFLINGLDPDKGNDPGDIRHMLPDGGKELFGLLEHHSKDRARYTFEYRICLPKGDERILKMHATNEFGPDGEIETMFGVVMDVTEHHLRQEALDKERTRAMRLAAEAQFLAQTDPLTGLANRRRTMTQLEKCIDRCKDEGRKLALIAFDIDHFKQVNDNHGHQVGDDVLIRIAELARGEVRASDLIGRTGGEEFVWMLPDAGVEETANAAERLRKAIEEGSAANGLPRVTASIGYAVWQPGDDASALLGKADAALYEAKESGRNKVQMAA